MTAVPSRTESEGVDTLLAILSLNILRRSINSCLSHHVPQNTEERLLPPDPRREVLVVALGFPSMSVGTLESRDNYLQNRLPAPFAISGLGSVIRPDLSR